MSTKLGTILADFTTSLATELIVGGTSATLSSATDDDGVALPSGRYFFTLDGLNSSKEHISCDLVGTALTNIKSLSRQGVETTGVVRKHRIGTTVSLTDFGHIKFINDLIAGTTTLNASAPLGYDGAPSSLTGNQLATVTYVLGVVNGGTVTFDKQVISGQTSGEALTANDVVYFKEADAKWYKADADLTATFDQLQLGIAQSTVAINATVAIAISGPVSGFTGLSAGSKYYLSNTAGAISSTAGTNSVFVGWALSTTILLFDPVLKTLPTQKEKDALAGSQGVPSSTNKYATQDNVSASSTDQSQLTQNGTVEFGEADATLKKNEIAQSFIPAKTKIRGVTFHKLADTGTFTGTVTISIYGDSGSDTPAGVLADVTLTNTQWGALVVGANTAIFSSEYASLVSGTKYWIRFTTSSADNSNHPNIGTNTAGGYSSGAVKYRNTTDGWVAIATIDLYFSTLEGNNSQIVKTGASGTIDDSQISSSIKGKYAVGSLESTYIKTYMNAYFPFIRWIGASTGGTTSVENWVTTGTVGVDHIVPPGGMVCSFESSGATSFSLGNNSGIFYKSSGILKWDSTNIIIMDWWAKLPASSTGDIIMGFGDDVSVYESTQATVVDKVCFTQTAAGVLSATIGKTGVAVSNTSIDGTVTQTNYNNYRIVLDLSNDAKFYVNGVLLATMSGANLPSTSGSIGIGFGRSNSADFLVTAPTISIEMNP